MPDTHFAAVKASSWSSSTFLKILRQPGLSLVTVSSAELTRDILKRLCSCVKVGVSFFAGTDASVTVSLSIDMSFSKEAKLPSCLQSMLDPIFGVLRAFNQAFIVWHCVNKTSEDLFVEDIAWLAFWAIIPSYWLISEDFLTCFLSGFCCAFRVPTSVPKISLSTLSSERDCESLSRSFSAVGGGGQSRLQFPSFHIYPSFACLSALCLCVWCAKGSRGLSCGLLRQRVAFGSCSVAG